MAEAAEGSAEWITSPTLASSCANSLRMRSTCPRLESGVPRVAHTTHLSVGLHLCYDVLHLRLKSAATGQGPGAPSTAWRGYWPGSPADRAPPPTSPVEHKTPCFSLLCHDLKRPSSSPVASSSGSIFWGQRELFHSPS
mmetsp:Transcript_14712/g.40112  ORF Transcript_14712/g.40112 Transcript_14712/m.40112 type:complete len:139 (-) Transcript_14712:592-1008(-)